MTILEMIIKEKQTWQNDVHRASNLLHICYGAIDFDPRPLILAYREMLFYASLPTSNSTFTPMVEEFERFAGEGLVRSLRSH